MMEMCGEKLSHPNTNTHTYYLIVIITTRGYGISLHYLSISKGMTYLPISQRIFFEFITEIIIILIENMKW